MTIHKEGTASIIITAIVTAGIYAICRSLIGEDYSWISTTIGVALFGLFLFIVSFFRVPNRRLTKGDNLLICPADGKVVVIEEITDVEYFNDRRLQVSIFMSPANVHQNRIPIDGEVVYNQYHKGKYLVAWDPKSSTDNERHSVVIKTAYGEILVKQIAGALAKRIMNYLHVGQKVNQTDEYGFIKFGSRVDLLLPVGTKLDVTLGQKVQGGVTILGRF